MKKLLEMVPLILIVMLSNTYLVSSNPYDISPIMMKRDRYCGNDLTRALRLVCQGNYHKAYDKRLDADFYNIDDYDEENKIPSDDLNYPFLQENSVKALIPLKSRRDPGGIVYECCYKPCTREHMRLYCGN